jgi:hypothetical protein
MAGSKDFKLAFGVDISELASGLANAQAAVTEAASTMKEALSGVQEAFSMVGQAALAVTAIMAGGAAFKEMVSAAVGLNVSSMELGKQFGISATQASVLKVALGETFLTQDQLASAGQRITRTLNTNEGAFKNLGVATRDSNGNFRSTLDIMTDVNARLLTFKEGTDRNVEGTKIYGRGWAEVEPILRLVAAALAQAQKNATELNLAVSAEGEAATKRYRDSMAALDEVMQGVRNTIGEALLPVLSSIGEWFRENGPAAIVITRASMATLGAVFITIREKGQEFADAIFGAFQNVSSRMNELVSIVMTGAHLIVDAFKLAKTGSTGDVFGSHQVLEDMKRDWAEGAAALKGGTEQQQEIYKQYLANIQADQKTAADSMAAMEANIFQDKTPTQKPPPGSTSDGGAKKASLMAQWENELAQDKVGYEQKEALQGSFQEFSKQMELAFWQEKLSSGAAKGAQEVELEKKVAELKLAINKQAFEAQLASLKEQEASFSKNAEARVAIAKREADEIGAAYGAISPQYEAALKHVTEVERQALEQQRQIAEIYLHADLERQLSSVEADEKALQTKYADHLISARQLEDSEIALENRRTEISEAGIRQRMAQVDPQLDPVLYAQLNAQIEALETQHQTRLTQIEQTSVKQREALEKQGFTMVENDFNSAINSMVKGTMTFQNAMKSMLRDVLTGIMDMLLKWAEQWAMTQIMNMLSAKTTNTQSVAGQAAVAGAAGVASWAGAPWPVDIGAAGFGAAMYADAMGYAVAAAAQSGYDIPAGVSPRTQLHPREMVLPADLADVVRSVAGSGGARGGTTNVRIAALDGASLYRVVTKNPAQFAKAMKRISGTGHSLR